MMGRWESPRYGVILFPDLYGLSHEIFLMGRPGFRYMFQSLLFDRKTVSRREAGLTFIAILKQQDFNFSFCEENSYFKIGEKAFSPCFPFRPLW